MNQAHDPLRHPPLSPAAWRMVRLICVITGTFGVLTGYPLFILISEKADALEGPSAIGRFFVVLLVALVVVSLIEWLRETIRGATHRRSAGAALLSILLLAIFEVFVIAYEEVSGAGYEAPYVLSEMAARVSGQQTPYAFLSSGDIKDPQAILQRLREGLDDPPSSSPEAWIVSDFARETQWTFFADVVSRPTGHEARVARLALQEPRIPPPGGFPAGPSFLPTGPGSLVDQALGDTGARQGAIETTPPATTPPASTPAPAFNDPVDTGNPLFDLPDVDFGAPPAAVVPQDRDDPELDALKRKVRALARDVPQGPIPPAGLIRWTEPPGVDPQSVSWPPTPWIMVDGVRVDPSDAARAGADLNQSDLQKLLAVELNRRILNLDFYQQDAFTSVDPSREVKPLLERHRRALLESDRAFDSLAKLEGQSGQSVGGSDADNESDADKRREIETQIERALRAQLPLRREMWLNRRLLEATFGDAIAKAPEAADPRRASLVVLGVLWILAGGVLGWVLATAIRLTHEGRDRPVRRAGIRGLLAGVVVVPAAVVSYVLVLRSANVVHDLWTFRDQLSWLFAPDQAPWDFTTSWLFPVAMRLDQLRGHPWMALVGILLFLGCMAVLWIALWLTSYSRLRRNLILAGAAAVAFANVLLFDLNLVFVFVLVGLVWAIPSLFLGMSTPYLQAGSALPRHWGSLAMASGISLVLLTLLRLVWYEIPWWTGVAGGLLLITGLLMRNGNKVEDYWPLAALVLAFAVYGATALAQHATFHGVLGDVHDLSVRGGSRINLWAKVRLPRLDQSTPGMSVGFNVPGGVQPGDYSPYDRLQQILDGEVFTGDAVLDQTVDRTEEQQRSRLKQERTRIARRLELSIVGSLGFWLTVGLLAAWSIARPPVHGGDQS